MTAALLGQICVYASIVSGAGAVLIGAVRAAVRGRHAQVEQYRLSGGGAVDTTSDQPEIERPSRGGTRTGAGQTMRPEGMRAGRGTQDV